MLYQRKLLSDGSPIGAPAPLPPEFVGLADVSLADLSAALPAVNCEDLGVVGHGFFPVPPAGEPGSRSIYQIAFMQRLTAEQRIAIRAAAKTDPVVEDFLDLLKAATLVDLDHADTQQGVAYLVAQNLITQADAAQLLA